MAPLLAGFLACTTYRESLNRGQRMYEENRYENALAIWRALDENALSPADRARYAYFRGMTDYRLNFRADARHWLALAKVADEAAPGALRADWQERLRESLTDLNQDVYGTRPSAPGDVMEQTLSTESIGANESASPPGSARATGVHPSTFAADADGAAGQACDGLSCKER